MKLYHISELEQLSGIKAPTIRAWERRYNFIQPGRTDTNIRMYDDHQVRKLLNIVTLLSNGYKLAKIAELDEEDIHAMVLGLQGVSTDPDAIATSLINELVMAMLTFDEHTFEQTYVSAVKRYGVFDAMLKVFYPLLEKIGIMWITDDMMPVQEHFASAVVRRKLIAAADALVLKRKRRKKFLLMLPPGEWHEIGLLFANYMIRSKEIETIYLGQNVPYEQVRSVLSKTEFSHVLLFFVTRPVQTDLEEIRKLMGLPKDLPLLYTGSSVVTQSLNAGKHTHLLQSPHDLLRYLV
ncbi:MerR family transcriptional regulator [Terrimonas sp. NA20]|uniref:MerR family transcriptional regulator n=1 Tax=Terrimonas ginsenosidimutans TaxID=2908004 RepID=A0ABS9KVB2_9BACT|nr:MerR family transcriptional regulator [Terrimonas ginsenosidimutans]MCG2616245.1 MerR family transcriptional regulator [Terrimonas ginsenosidimutans]